MEVAPQYQNIPPFLTETELEVAVILSELPELLRDPGDRPHIPPHLRWGARRRRRRSPRLRSSSSPSAAIPEDDPSPSTSLPHRPRLDDETKGDAAATAAAAIAGSPSSPLSFPASGSEEPESHHPPPPPPLPAPSITSGMKYSSKNSKHHKEMLKEYSHVVASLSAESSILRQEIEQYKIKCTILKAANSQLIEHRSKTVLPKLPEAEAAPSAVGAPPADWAAEHRQRSAAAKRKVEFDLNKLSEEAEAAAAAAAAEREAAAAAAAQSAHKAAKWEKARRRKRRMEIQRAKRISAAAAATAVSAPGSMPSTVHMMPRLR